MPSSVELEYSKAVEHMEIIGKNDEYGTPPKEYNKELLKKLKVKPIYDYCASDINHVCKLYYTKKDNALTKDWVLDGFCNFPYSEQYRFMEKAWKEHQKNNIELLILAFAKTDTRWWHRFVEGKAEVHFIDHRIKFLNGKGKIPATMFCGKCHQTVKRKTWKKNYCERCKDCRDLEQVCSRCNWLTKERENCSPYPSCWIIYRKVPYPSLSIDQFYKDGTYQPRTAREKKQ